MKGLRHYAFLYFVLFQMFRAPFFHLTFCIITRLHIYMVSSQIFKAHDIQVGIDYIHYLPFIVAYFSIV